MTPKGNRCHSNVYVIVEQLASCSIYLKRIVKEEQNCLFYSECHLKIITLGFTSQ